MFSDRDIAYGGIYPGTGFGAYFWCLLLDACSRVDSTIRNVPITEHFFEEQPTPVLKLWDLLLGLLVGRLFPGRLPEIYLSQSICVKEYQPQC